MSARGLVLSSCAEERIAYLFKSRLDGEQREQMGWKLFFFLERALTGGGVDVLDTTGLREDQSRRRRCREALMQARR